MTDLAESERLVQESWQRESCLIVDGLTYGQGRIKLLDLERVQDGRVVSVRLHLRGETTAAALLGRNPSATTVVSALCESRSEDSGLRVVGGEGGQGGDGFLALVRASDDYLLWILFFHECNPFVEVAIQADSVSGVTSLDDRWTVSLSEPSRVSVMAGDVRGWDSRTPRL